MSTENAPYQELVFFEIDRALHYVMINSLIEEGKIVISDRGPASSLAYQGYGRGVDLDFIRRANEVATKGRVADLTLLFDLDPEVAQGRLRLRQGEKTRFDLSSMDLHRRMRSGFLQEFFNEPMWEKIDASLFEDEVFARVRDVVKRRLRF